MENEINPEIIKTTQVSLGKYVKRPPLSEKLLKKPPFRFLHDIITTVLKTTGFFENLFDQEELISDNVKDRESKIAFLNKVIYVLSSTTGKTLSVKPSKIVAGQEPDKTNELLQCLAIALDKKLSSEAAVKKYKESFNSSQAAETKTTTKTGETKASKSVKKGTDSKKLIAKSSEKLIDHKNETNLQSTSKNNKDKINENKFKRKEISNKTESHPKKSQQTKASSIKAVDNKRQNSEDTEGKSVKKNKDIERKSIKNSAKSSVKEKLQPEILNKLQSQDSNVSVDKENQTGVKINEDLKSPRIEQNTQINLNDSYTIGEPDLNSATSTHDLIEPVNAIVEDKKSLEINVITNLADIGDELSIESNKADDDKNIELGGNYQVIVNPTVKYNNQNNEHELKDKEISPPKSANDFNQIVRPQSVRPSSSRPGAPRMREKLESIVRDTDNLILGKVNIIVENTQNEEEEETSIVVVEDQQVELTPISNDKDLNISSKEHGHLVQQILDSQKELSQIGGKTEIEWQFGAQKARAAVNQEIEQLKFNIQALSRVANPLGKLLDHVQEDVEVMRQELHQWTNIYEEVSKEMLKQKAINEDSLLPLHTKLRHMERDIEEKREKINDIKVLINRNESRIEKLLANGDVQ